jgi:hypothetical protein
MSTNHLEKALEHIKEGNKLCAIVHLRQAVYPDLNYGDALPNQPIGDPIAVLWLTNLYLYDNNFEYVRQMYLNSI